MRLGIAFGARGKGKALAHYESNLHVINLTKLKGAGSLAHEWGHALDSFLGKQLGLKGIQSFATLGSEQFLVSKGELGKAICELKYTIKYSPLTVKMCDEEYRKSLETIHTQLRESCSAIITRYKQKFNKSDDDTEVEELVTLSNKLIASLDKSDLSTYSEYLGKITDYDPGFMTHWASRLIRQREIVDEHYKERKESVIKGTAPSNHKSKFYTDAIDLDKGRRIEYYSAIEEMFARAFEAYIFDKLYSQGIQSSYLVHSVTNNYYGELSPYPDKEDRQRINEAFDKLIKETKAYFNLGRFEYSKLYADNSTFKSYRESIKVISKSSEPTQQSLKQQLSRLHGEPISVDYRQFMDKLAIWGKRAFGFEGIGFGEISAHSGRNTNSKAFIVSGKRFVIDSKAKREKQVEALIEALVYFTVELKYRTVPSKIRSQVEQGATYSLCKHIGLDVRTYCLGAEYDAISNNKELEDKYISSCKEVSSIILNSIN